MTGYIIYHSDEAVKNSGFIEMFKSAGVEYNICFEYVPYHAYTTKQLPDFIINRTRDYNVSIWYEKHHVKVLHNSLITRIGNNKYETLTYLNSRLPDIITDRHWCPESTYISADDIPYIIDKYINKRYVIKSISGHGGNQVFNLNDNSEDITHIGECLKGQDCVLQELIDSDSNDIRVYVVGGEIYAAVLRHGTHDFRSNFSLGGSVSSYMLTDKQFEYIKYFIEALGSEALAMVGIDFILTKDNQLLFNELEEMVGSRMLYQCSKHDIVKDYVAWIAHNSVKRRA